MFVRRADKNNIRRFGQIGNQIQPISIGKLDIQKDGFRLKLARQSDRLLHGRCFARDFDIGRDLLEEGFQAETRNGVVIDDNGFRHASNIAEVPVERKDFCAGFARKKNLAQLSSAKS